MNRDEKASIENDGGDDDDTYSNKNVGDIKDNYWHRPGNPYLQKQNKSHPHLPNYTFVNTQIPLADTDMSYAYVYTLCTYTHKTHIYTQIKARARIYSVCVPAYCIYVQVIILARN